MNRKYFLIGLVGMVVGVLLTSTVMVLAGTPAGPGTAPDDTWSYTQEFSSKLPLEFGSLKRPIAQRILAL